MKRTLLFIAFVLASLTMSAQDDLTVGDIQNSGCLRNTRGDASEPLPTIVLTKEGNVLSVQLLNYESNCGTADFNVASAVSDGSDGKTCSVNISVVPYIPDDEAADCYCPYNVSFTVRDLESNSFYLSCWWYEGQVTLEEGKPFVLEDVMEEATIDGMKYILRKAMGRALLADGSTQEGEVTIPSKLNYEGQTYQVIGISFSAFKNNKNLTKVIIPKTIKNMDLSNYTGIDSNPFSGCTALQSIDVEEGNPAVCSVDGVLFNKGKDKLISYPAGALRESYTVPESVTWIEGLAFSYSQHLRKVTLTDNVTSLGSSAFYESKSLEEVRLPSGLKVLANYLFGNCPRLKSVTIPQNVTHLGLKAFENCTSLTSVTMPESITSADYSVFEGCKSLKSVTLSPKLGSIEYSMFSNCSSLKEILIPNGVTMVGSEAFKNCSALTSLDLPESVNRLGSKVFAGCKLKSLYIRGIIDSKWMSSNIFRDMDTNTNLYVKLSEVEKYKAIYQGPVYPLPENTEINGTTFPDSNFRNWVLSQEYGTDGVLTSGELESVTSLNISRLDIHNLKGIEYFTALKDLNCMTNKLTSLDLSKNTALEKLECVGNRMTTINLLENKELRFLNCGGNSLTAIDVSGCTELDTLACSGNQLTALDVSKNSKLICLECYSNQLTSLDLSKNTALRRVHCNNNQLATLDVSNNMVLNLLECSSNLLTTLDVTKNSALIYLSCTNNKLTTFYVSDNKSLKDLSCSNNQLTSLDVSGCSALKSLGCNDNQLTTLNLSGCPALEYVNCNSNQLETLDLSDNSALTTLFCDQNQIKGIGMDALVESLPNVSEGSLNVMYFKDEQNVMTTTQVAAAKAKGWTPYIWTYSLFEEYAGSEPDINIAYRPFVENGKVWKVGAFNSGNPVQWVEYCYFDGDTIIDGKTCKQMMLRQYVSHDFPNYELISPQDNSLSYVGAWYEEDQKVYKYDSINNQFKLMYDFSIEANGTLEIDNFQYVIGPRQTEGLKGFKGVYRDVMWCEDGEQRGHSATWLEGVGDIYGPTTSVTNGYVDPMGFLMSCTVGDEVIYFNDDYEDGATPEEARKKRFDFTHTIKTKPQSRMTRAAEASLYGEYNEQQLGINLDPLDDAYMVRITDETGKTVYEKNINAGSIVGLNIDISAYTKGRYTVTVENSNESFTGEFEARTTGIKENVKIEELKNGNIYNLQGQRIRSLQKGLNIVNGQKVYVK